jgi:hypothetical protein
MRCKMLCSIVSEITNRDKRFGEEMDENYDLFISFSAG